MKGNIILYVILFCLTLGCQSQNGEAVLLHEKDLQLVEIYDKYSENRHDYGSKKGEARDTILNRFKETLLKTLSSDKAISFPFDSLSNTIKVIASKDKKLRIFSWDELNGGSWHIYNSAFQYDAEGKTHSGILSLNDSVNDELLHYTDVIHFEIEDVDKGLYLVKGYGTHGSGKDFYVYRLLSFEKGKVADCSSCFDGEDRLVFIKPRGDKVSPKYDKEKKEITYLEMKPSFHDGEETGFERPTGKVLKLKYKEGAFIKLDN